MLTANFAFAPLQFIRVTVHGLNLRGRVMRCIADGEQRLYDCQYVDANGELRRTEFYEDELEVAKCR